MTIKKTIYVNSSGVLASSVTDTNGFQIGGTPLIFKRGDTVTLNVIFLNAAGQPVTLADGTQLIMAVKPINEYDSTVLYAYNTITVNGQAAASGYDFNFALNSTTLAEAMRLNEPFEADVASTTGMLELTWTTDGGETYRSTQNVAPFTVNNDVIRGTESTPLGLPSPEAWLNQRAIRFDTPLTLTSAQKARAQANLGFPKTNWNAATAPDEDNDETEGYAVGSLWIDATGKEAYRCVKDDEGAAEWIETTLEAAEVLALISNFNYTGPYDGGTEYAVGDLATQGGSLYYRKNANGGNVGDTPFDGSSFWDLIASAGQNGAAATITIGTITTSSNSSASVTNSGTSTNAVLNFVIPRGVIDTTVDAVVNSVTFGRGSGNDANSTVAGEFALSSNTSGIWNSAFGRSALLNNTSGSFNVAVGNSALRSNTSGSSNTSIGTGSLHNSTTGQDNTAIGGNALFYNNGSRNTAVGLSALFLNTSGENNVAFGHAAMNRNTTGSANASCGVYALQFNEVGNYNTASGGSSLVFNESGSYNSGFGHLALAGSYGGASIAYNNTTGLGYNAQITGSNQVQLGNSSTTTYAYGAVQNRSDVRDKADIRDTTLGLEFIDSLRPVDFKWDMREDYRPAIPDIVAKPLELSDDATDEEKNQYAEQLVAYEEFIEAKDQWLEDSKLTNITHDGSKKRSRYHHGLIAQEVKEVLDQQGIDFGGFQDHSLKGGDDVLSVGYIELIAPMIKAIQQLKARVEQLESEQTPP
jgi:hypothetical protein